MLNFKFIDSLSHKPILLLPTTNNLESVFLYICQKLCNLNLHDIY